MSTDPGASSLYTKKGLKTEQREHCKKFWPLFPFRLGWWVATLLPIFRNAGWYCANNIDCARDFEVTGPYCRKSTAQCVGAQRSVYVMYNRPRVFFRWIAPKHFFDIRRL